MTKQRPYCLSIAGFDPSGGAGIVADCKTFEQLKVHGLSVITGNTIQTEDQFYSYNWMSLETIIDQISKLLDRYHVRYVKIGLIKDVEMLTAILNLLHKRIENPFIIWDPILQPTHGGDEVNQDRFSKDLKSILDKVSILTPNLPEYKRLFGDSDPKVVSEECQKIIYLKGGHSAIKGKDTVGKEVLKYDTSFGCCINKIDNVCFKNVDSSKCAGNIYENNKDCQCQKT